MYDKQHLIGDLHRLSVDPAGTLLVHSSMKAIGPVDGGADTVLDALSEHMRDGLLVLPTHTWDRINADQPVFSVTDTPCCVGILPERFRKRPGVIRSQHPTHSVAALGRDAIAFTEGDACFETPLHRSGPWGRLLDRRATLLFIGCDLTKNTYMHGVEEWLDIPDNLTDSMVTLFTERPDGTVVPVRQRQHKGHRSDTFWKVEPLLLENGAMRTGTFGGATVRIVDTLRLTEILYVLLERNPWLFADDRPLDRRLYPMYAPGPR